MFFFLVFSMTLFCFSWVFCLLSALSSKPVCKNAKVKGNSKRLHFPEHIWGHSIYTGRWIVPSCWKFPLETQGYVATMIPGQSYTKSPAALWGSSRACRAVAKQPEEPVEIPYMCLLLINQNQHQYLVLQCHTWPLFPPTHTHHVSFTRNGAGWMSSSPRKSFW